MAQRQKSKFSSLYVGRQTSTYNDFFTPNQIAQIIAKHLRPFLRKQADNGKTVRILEPSCGTGNLLWPLMRAAQEEGCQLEITVMDLQDDYLDQIVKKAKRLEYKVEDKRSKLQPKRVPPKLF